MYYARTSHLSLSTVCIHSCLGFLLLRRPQGKPLFKGITRSFLDKYLNLLKAEKKSVSKWTDTSVEKWLFERGYHTEQKIMTRTFDLCLAVSLSVMNCLFVIGLRQDLTLMARLCSYRAREI